MAVESKRRQARAAAGIAQPWRAIVWSVASQQGLALVITGSLAEIAIEHIDQQMESDAAFLTRLATIYDAMATVKNGKLLFIKAGAGTSASGAALPAITIDRIDGDTHRFAIADRGAYTGVIAYWHDGARQNAKASPSDGAKPPRKQKPKRSAIRC